MKKNLFLVAISIMLIEVFVSCSSDDDNVSLSVERIAGTWICYEQTWHEDGEVWTHSYTGNNYYIVFNSNSTGSMDSGPDELMEIGRSHTFTYVISGSKIVTNIYGEEIWTVSSLSSDQMILKWEDEDYWIECKFKKYGS